MEKLFIYFSAALIGAALFGGGSLLLAVGASYIILVGVNSLSRQHRANEHQV